MTKRALSVFLSILYFANSVVWVHASETQFWANRREAYRLRSAADVPPAWPDVLDPSELGRDRDRATLGRFQKNLPPEFLAKYAGLLRALPLDHGRVQTVRPGDAPNGPVVILLQDVHHNWEAQKHIAAAVTALAPYVDSVALEGTATPLDEARFRAFPDRRAVQRAADVFLRENRISGPIHAALTGTGPFPDLRGIEDAALYESNVNAYRRSARHRDEQKDIQEKERVSLEKQKAVEFSPELLTYDRAVTAHHRGELGLAAYARTVSQGKWMSPQGTLFLRAQALEEKIDFQRVERERTDLISLLTSRMDHSAIQALVARGMAYRAGGIHYAEFYGFLRELCDRVHVSLAPFPAFDDYVRYVQLADRIDPATLLDELSVLEKEGYDRLARTDAERALVAQSRNNGRLGKLLDFDLTFREWREYHRSSITPPSSPLAPFEDFYRAAEARDGVMAAHLLKLLAMGGDKKAVLLVAGGFHTEGLVGALTKAGPTVISFAPRVEKIDTRSGPTYLNVFAREKTPLEKMFDGEKLFLATPPIAAVDQEIHLPAAVALETPGKETKSFVQLMGNWVSTKIRRVKFSTDRLVVAFKDGSHYWAIRRPESAGYQFDFSVDPFRSSLAQFDVKRWGVLLGSLGISYPLGQILSALGLPLGGDSVVWFYGLGVLSMTALGVSSAENRSDVESKAPTHTAMVNLLDFGSYTKEGIHTKMGLSKTQRILNHLVKMGMRDIYIYNGLYAPSKAGIVVHTESTMETKLLKVGDVVMLVQDYAPKRLVIRQGDTPIVLDDRFGSNFSIDDMGELNPDVVSGSTNDERWVSFAKFVKEADRRGISVTVDFVPWLSPSGLTPERLGWAKEVMKVPDSDARSDLNLLLNNKEYILYKHEGRRYLVKHYMGIDQILPDFDNAGYFSYLESHLRRLIDAGVSRVRVDMAHHLSDSGWGQWEKLINGAKTYAAGRGQSFHFVMEAYGDWPEEFLKRFPDEQVYDPSAHHNFIKIANPEDPEHRYGLDHLFKALAYANTNDAGSHNRGKRVIFPSNYDMPSLANIGGPTKAFMKLLLVYEHWGVPLMVDLRELLGEDGQNIPQAGGQGRDHNGHFEHPFPAVPRTNYSDLLWALDAPTSPARWVREWRAMLSTARSVELTVSGEPARYVTVKIVDKNNRSRTEQLDFYPELPEENHRARKVQWSTRVSGVVAFWAPVLGVLLMGLLAPTPVWAADGLFLSAWGGEALGAGLFWFLTWGVFRARDRVSPRWIRWMSSVLNIVGSRRKIWMDRVHFKKTSPEIGAAQRDAARVWSELTGAPSLQTKRSALRRWKNVFFPYEGNLDIQNMTNPLGKGGSRPGTNWGRLALSLENREYREAFEAALGDFKKAAPRNAFSVAAALGRFWGTSTGKSLSAALPSGPLVQLEVCSWVDRDIALNTIERLSVLNKGLADPVRLILAGDGKETIQFLRARVGDNPDMVVLPYPVGGQNGLDLKVLNGGFKEILARSHWQGPLRLVVSVSESLAEGVNPRALQETPLASILREALLRFLTALPLRPIDFNGMIQILGILSQNA